MKKTIKILAVALFVMASGILEARSIKITNSSPQLDASNNADANTLIINRHIKGITAQTSIPGTQNYVITNMPNEPFTLQLQYGRTNPKKLPDLNFTKGDNDLSIVINRDDKRAQ